MVCKGLFRSCSAVCSTVFFSFGIFCRRAIACICYCFYDLLVCGTSFHAHGVG